MTHLFCKRLKDGRRKFRQYLNFGPKAKFQDFHISVLSLIIEHVKTISTMLKLNLTKRMLTGIDPG